MTPDTAVLDNPAYHALNNAHAHLAERSGRVVRYRTDVSPFLALPDDPTDGDWSDVAALAGPGELVAPSALRTPPPPGWRVVRRIPGVQLVAQTLLDGPDDEAVILTPQDVPEMIALVEDTRPGPFLPRTIELGTYLGIRRNGRLVAMAGERLRPPGFTEISAVCTAAEVRGQGLATRLIRAVAHRIVERGERPFLHAAAENTTAIRLYESLGFARRSDVVFQAIRVPDLAGQGSSVR